MTQPEQSAVPHSGGVGKLRPPRRSDSVQTRVELKGKALQARSGCKAVGVEHPGMDEISGVSPGRRSVVAASLTRQHLHTTFPA